MAQTPEYLTTSKFYFELSGGAVGGMQLLPIKKVSGVSVTVNPAGEGESSGVTKAAVSDVQTTVAGVSTNNVTLEFNADPRNDVLQRWFRSVHAPAKEGGGTDWANNRCEASLVVYKLNNEEGARFNFVDAIPVNYTTTKLEAGSTELFGESVEIYHAGLNRVK